MDRTWFYDLISTLLKEASEFKEFFDPDVLCEADEERYCKRVNDFLESMSFRHDLEDDFPENSQVVEDIINLCVEEKDYYLYKAFICEFDRRIDVNDDIIDKFNFLSTASTFVALNGNYETTKILLLPKVNSIKNYQPHENFKGEHSPRRTAFSGANDFNDCLHNVYIVMLDELNGYLPKNIILSIPEKKANRDSIRIGVSPICNIPNADLLIPECFIDETVPTQKTQWFRIKELKYIKEINERFINSYNTACANQCDIFVAPEMLGTKDLTETTDQGFNDLYVPNIKNKRVTPVLTLPPTCWENDSNILSVFSGWGQLVGRQEKQHGFTFSKDGMSWKERLNKPSKEILLIHIQGWGRFAFPICIDYLICQYRKIMTSALHANFIICPAFSFGEYNFDLSGDAEAEFEVRTICINSCSALNGSPSSPNSSVVGLVSTPIVNKNRIQKIVRQCDGNCKETCLFILDIPFNFFEQESVEINHVFE